MKDKFEITGEWYLPTDRTNRVFGTLTFDPQDGTNLELYGELEGDVFLPEIRDQEIILGLTSESKQVTLYKCHMTSSGGATLVQGEESGKPSRSYKIIYLLIGLHATSLSDLKFNQISAEIFNLGEWVGISGFRRQEMAVDELRNNEVKVEYKLPESIDFEIEKNITGKFNFIANRPGLSRYQKSVTINQRVEFCAISVNEMDIGQLLNYVISFQNLLTLALYKGTYPLAITLRGDNHTKDYGNGEQYEKSIELYRSSRNFKSDEKPQFDREMIFDYRRIKDDFPKIIKNWFSKYELLKPAFDLVFEQFYNGNRFTVNTFLNLAQSAETFHARIHNHTRIPREEYKEMKLAILAVSPTQYHSWLNDQFSFGNNLNLQARLTELTDKYQNKILDRILGDKELFVLNVKYSRNYYTHYSKEGAKKALKGLELFYLSERLKILLVCVFLIEVGFDSKKLSDYLNSIKWIHFSHLSDWSSDED